MNLRAHLINAAAIDPSFGDVATIAVYFDSHRYDNESNLGQCIRDTILARCSSDLRERIGKLELLR